MDRLFLRFLVEEIADSVSGRRIRTIAEATERQGLVLSLGPPGPRELIVSAAPKAPGLFFGSPPWSTRSARPSLKKWFLGSTVRTLTAEALDRGIRLEAEDTRLSGRKTRFELYLEIASTRTDLYVLELPERLVLEVISSGRARGSAGERLPPRREPPGARPIASSAAELEDRLRGLRGSPGRKEILRASGLTPFLANEMMRLMHRGTSLGDAFARVTRALESPKATLLVGRAGHFPRFEAPLQYAPVPPLLPIDENEKYNVREMSNFNEAMAEGARIAEEARTALSLYRELSRAVRNRSAAVRALRDKLSRQLRELPDPIAARRHGERLLAAHAQARDSRPGFVIVPDPFDELSGDVEVPIDPRLTLVANAERWFERSRKAERTRVAVGARLEALGHERDYIDHLASATEDASTASELEALRGDVSAERVIQLPVLSTHRLRGSSSRQLSGAGRDRRLPPRRFETDEGHVILVGRSARQNEEVTFKMARPRDLWLHAAGRAGSHVVLRPAPGIEVSERVIESAAGLAAYYSKGRNDSYVEVLVTERKNVQKLRGAPMGTVRVHSARSVRVRPRSPSTENGAS